MKTKVQKTIGLTWRIVSLQFGYPMFAAEAKTGPQWSDVVSDAYTYDDRDSREAKLAFWKADATRLGLDASKVEIIEV